jgi:two-component system phosphate regulon sensor histidine kinase PhoR
MARDDLIAQVTHELRTPLTVLRMYGETLLSERVGGADRREYLETIVAESERLGRLVDRIAAVAREETVLEPAGACEPGPMLEQVVHQFHAVAAVQGGQVDLEGSAADGMPIRMQEADFRLILEVLIDNAIRYGGDPPVVRVRHECGAGQLIVEVRDRGEGVGDDERERVFERWVRGSAGRRSSSRGAGMGLHLARKLARLQGGDVTLEARSDRGTCARVRVPLAPLGNSECSES